MRSRIPRQSDLFVPLVDHELARELEQIDQVILMHPEWESWVHADLTKGVDPRLGRSGMTAGQVLRLRLAQLRVGLSLRKFACVLADSFSLREFLGFGPFGRVPRRGTLQENLEKVQPETWGRIIKALATSAEVAEFETGEKVRVDATVTAAKIHTPSDSSLLWDCVRVLTRLMNRGRVGLGVDFEDHSKVAKKLRSKIFFAHKKTQRTPAYKALLAASQRVDEQAASVLERIRKLAPSELDASKLRAALIPEIERYRAFLARVVDQTTRRVINDEKVPASEKILSIFEPHTSLIVKNGRDAQYGHKITLTAGASGLVLDCVIEQGNPCDVTVAVRQLERQKKLFGKAPHTAAFDGAYASRENFDAAKALGTERPVFSKGRGLTAEEMAGSRRTYGRLRNFRAGMEATVSFLKCVFGLDCCTWKGARRFASYVWSAVLAANLTILARARLCAG